MRLSTLLGLLLAAVVVAFVAFNGVFDGRDSRPAPQDAATQQPPMAESSNDTGMGEAPVAAAPTPGEGAEMEVPDAGGGDSAPEEDGAFLEEAEEEGTELSHGKEDPESVTGANEAADFLEGYACIFWDAFLTRTRAETFARNLSLNTDIAVYVGRSPGGYRPSFIFSDEADLETKLDIIEAATGLAVRESGFTKVYMLPGAGFSSQIDAKQHADALQRSVGEQFHVIRGASVFQVGVAYSSDADLAEALQALRGAE